MPTDMTKREYYAAVALNGLLANGSYGRTDVDRKNVAADAAKIADEMMAALEVVEE